MLIELCAAVLSVDKWNFAVPQPINVAAVEGALQLNSCHTATVAVGGRSHADVVPRQRVYVDEGSGSKLAVGMIELDVVAADELLHAGSGYWYRYRLMTIFSKNHLLPKFCIVCLMLHIYRYLGLKLN